MDQLDELRRLYPTHPLWALKAVEHLRARLGAYGEAVAAGREILARAARGEANYRGPWVPALARLEIGHSLVSDLRPAEARPFLLTVAKDGIPGNAAAAPRARYLLGRSLELEGDRDGALAHYRIAAAAADKEWRQRASAAVSTPIPPARVHALLALGEARRRREAKGGPRRSESDAQDERRRTDSGGADDAIPFAREALRHWPQSMEAALLLVDERLVAGDASGRAGGVAPRRPAAAGGDALAASLGVAPGGRAARPRGPAGGGRPTIQESIAGPLSPRRPRAARGGWNQGLFSSSRAPRPGAGTARDFNSAFHNLRLSTSAAWSVPVQKKA